jgi:hypothetical protein
LRIVAASIVITQTGSGKIIKTLPVSIGTSQVTLNAASLAVGAYTYTIGKSIHKTYRHSFLSLKSHLVKIAPDPFNQSFHILMSSN